MIPLRSIPLLLALLAAAPAVAAVPTATLVAYAELPAATFVPGPTAGRWQGEGTLRGHTGPYAGKQPVQGFSGVLADGDGWFTVLVDNGFGALETSADHRLTFYRMKPTWGGAHAPGSVRIGDAIRLADPRRRIPWTITHQFDHARPLTGADLDPESFVRMRDGSYWVGDEFGPFLVHVDARGQVLDAPVSLPDPEGGEVRSPQNPYNEESAAVRFLDALRANAIARAGGHPGKTPQLSPWHLLVADGDGQTGAPDRAAGASEIVDVKSLHAAGFQVVPWTVNERARMDRLLALGVDGLITDRPDLLRLALEAFDANRDGKPGDFLDADGNVDPARFDAQGHRGARDLRPESTLPAFEAALDHGMTTLETDCAITRDGIAVLSHEPRLEPTKTRRLDGRPLPVGEGVVIRRHAARELQAEYDRAMTLTSRPLQTLDPAESPVSKAFAATRGLPSAHAVLTLGDLFAFVKAYEAHYQDGPGRAAPRAKARAAAARRVRFNLETKISPAEERAGLTPAPEAFARVIGRAVVTAGLADRTTIQSFDYRPLLTVQQEFPRLGTAFLLEDALPFAMRGTGQATTSAPHWPWRVTGLTHAMRAKRSGGFEALAIEPAGRYLYAMMEKPLAGQAPDRLLVAEFDTRARRYTGKRWWYPWDVGATSVADFTLVNARQGLAIERDDGEGRKALIKRLYLVTLGAPGSVAKKELVADLMRIENPQGLAGPGQPGDVARAQPFGMPFWTIEGVAVLDPRHVLILNDNNYPYSAGRHQGTGQPDDDEWAVLRLAKPLPVHRGFKPVKWR